MKFIKISLTLLLSIILIFLSVSYFLFVSVYTTVFNPGPLHGVIDQLDIPELAKLVVDQDIFRDVEDPNSISPEGPQFDIEVIFNGIIDNLTEEDELLIKDEMKRSISEFYRYLNNETDQLNIKIDIERFFPLISKAISSSPDVIENLELPFTVCEGTDDSQCVEQEAFEDVLLKVMNDELSIKDVPNFLPICNAGVELDPSGGEIPTCLPQDVADLIEELPICAANQTPIDSQFNLICIPEDISSFNLYEGDVLGADTFSFDSFSGDIPREINFTEDQLPDGINQLREFLGYARYAHAIYWISALIIISLLFIVNRLAALKWIGGAYLIAGVALAVLSLVSENYLFETLLDENTLADLIQLEDTKLLEVATDAIRTYLSFLTSRAVYWGTWTMAFGFALLVAGIFVPSLFEKEDKNKEPKQLKTENSNSDQTKQ